MTADPRAPVPWRPGQQVRVLSGPFQDFIGAVVEVLPGLARLRVQLSLFFKKVVVELDDSQVEPV